MINFFKKNTLFYYKFLTNIKVTISCTSHTMCFTEIKIPSF